MNLGIFNRVNLKEGEGGGMYSEWASLASLVRHETTDRESVLSKFPDAGKDVAMAIVKELASNISLTQAPAPSNLSTDRDVLWCMEVICYGLSLPLNEHDAIRDCVHIYCDWLSVLHPVPNVSVPRPIIDDPNLYARKMIGHLHNLFIPRKGEGADTIKRQAVLCHRVLRTLQQAAQCSTVMSHETWESLLVFMLAINETLLAAPTVRDDVGDQLCERVLSVLFEVWLVACGKCFPGPPLWKTLREMAITWRHRGALISTWARVCLALTHRLLGVMYPPSFPKHQLTDYDSDHWNIPNEVTDETVVQSWFRFLHTIGSPVDLSRPQIISQTPKFLQYAMISDADPSSHPCLRVLPLNFLIAIKGVSNLVDAFLGVMSEPLVLPEEDTKKDIPTPTSTRRTTKSFSSSVTQKGISKSALISLGRTMSTSTTSSAAPSVSSMTSVSGSWEVSSASGQQPTILRPKCNSLLHLFGEWLFEAAQVGTGLYSNPNLTREGSGRRSGSLGSAQDSLELETTIATNRYQAGRATALASLCRIFCSKKTGEQILPVYYARFYLVLMHGLKMNEKREVEEPLISILMNCADILRLDLDGIQIMVPYILEALERVLPEKDLNIKINVNLSELRRASIHILLSLLCLPLHFQNLAIKDLIGGHNDRALPTMGQFRTRIISLLINALQVESDPHNTHMLLGGLLVLVQETAGVEQQSQDKSSVQQSFPSGLSSNSNDSASSLFVKATYLVCHRLISSWKGDLSVSLAALELLCGLANSGITDIERVEWERGMKWVCDYIMYQCWRPPQAHSKDLHSSVVAAFTAVSSWILARPDLLMNKHCLHNLLEVVELGISGSKSQGKRRDEPIKLKDEKELKPVSMRVRDAAEALLTVVMEHANYFPSPCGAESVSSLIDENVLLGYASVNSVEAFKYFVLHDNILLALLEDPLGNHQEPQPVVNVIIRGGFGRHCWSFQLRQLPRYRSSTTRGRTNQSSPGRPVSLSTGSTPHHVKHSFFPDNISRIPQCAAERSIPDLDGDLTEINQLLRQQKNAEIAALAVTETEAEDCPECVPPRLCGEFQTARLFLSHFGFLQKLETGKPSVIPLNSKKEGFFRDLELLDKLEPRTSDTVHVFYVKTGQSHYQEILANVESSNNVSQHFMQVLKSLGWPVNSPSFSGSNGENDNSSSGSGGGWFSGHKRMLYWADAMSEITFLVPTLQPLPRIRHQRTEKDDKAKRQLTTYPVFAVWLESFEDLYKFPLDEMITHTGCGQEGWQSQNCSVIFLHALQNGLFRVKLQPSSYRPSIATPLVDGIVVSRNKVGTFVRQTALNLCRRKRLDNESYQPPHTRRRLKIQEFVAKYEIFCSRADLLTSLFQ